MDTYREICRLINKEIDEIVEDRITGDGVEFENETERERYRDDLITNYLSFLRKDLISDNSD